jgi:putative ribosome biogenesis GTPase RsgA
VVLAVNKSDLKSSAQFGEREVSQFARAYGSEFSFTSAKTGDQVENVFARLATHVVDRQLHRE